MVEEAKFLPGTEELWLGAEGRDSSYAALSPSWAAAESESLLGYNGNSVAGSQPSPVSDADMSLSRKILDAQPPWTTGDCMQRLFGAACGRRNRRGQTAGRRCRLSGETLRSSHIRSQKPPPAVAQRPGLFCCRSACNTWSAFASGKPRPSFHVWNPGIASCQGAATGIFCCQRSERFQDKCDHLAKGKRKQTERRRGSSSFPMSGAARRMPLCANVMVSCPACTPRRL